MGKSHKPYYARPKLKIPKKLQVFNHARVNIIKITSSTKINSRHYLLVVTTTHKLLNNTLSLTSWDIRRINQFRHCRERNCTRRNSLIHAVRMGIISNSHLPSGFTGNIHLPERVTPSNVSG